MEIGGCYYCPNDIPSRPNDTPKAMGEKFSMGHIGGNSGSRVLKGYGVL